MTIKIIANLIDGQSTKRFKTVKAAAKFVQEMEDFGEDGRRSWGFQGEFGTYEFDGITWEQIIEAWKSEIAVRIVDCAEWQRYEWDFAEGQSVQVWARMHNVFIDGEQFVVKSVQSRFQVEAVEYAGMDDFSTAVIGVYCSMEAAVDCCRRYFTAAKADSSFVSEALFNEYAAAYAERMKGNSEVPF